MSTVETDVMFTYFWTVDKKQENVTCIRIYGIDKKNRTICLRINNFLPYCYLELPQVVEWNLPRAQVLGNKINQILGESAPITKELVYRYKLYEAHLDSKGNRKKFPYLKCSFSTYNDLKRLVSMCYKPLNIYGLGVLKLKVHEQDASEILQLVCNADIPTAGPVLFRGKRVGKEEQYTQADKEYIVKWQNIKRYKEQLMVKPKLMGFDIEVNSTNTTAMPVVEKPGDKVFQISCSFAHVGDNEEQYKNYIISMGDPDPEIVGKDVIIIRCKTEHQILQEFTKLVNEEKPHIAIGYNIFMFDLPYMYNRAAKVCYCVDTFDRMGFNLSRHSKLEEIRWSSSAYKNQEFHYIDVEGVIFVDLLPIAKRDYKLNNYKLKTVSMEILKDTKDDLSAQGIFKCYRIGTKKNPDGTYSERARKAMGKCGKYCMKDTVLVVRLFEAMNLWYGLSEQASTFNTSIFSLFTQGQQIKVYSQIYKYCLQNDIVVEKDGYKTKEDERYMGAYVFEPQPGLYERVVPFDFASLYPTTIIAYNIDYSTWVTDETIPDSLCHVFRWSEHQNCVHDPKVIRKNELTAYIDKEKEKLKKLRERRDTPRIGKAEKEKAKLEIERINMELKPYVSERGQIAKTITKKIMCGDRYYRFLKEPKGVVPTILQNMLDARAQTRKLIKANKKEIFNIKYSDLTTEHLAELNIEKSRIDSMPESPDKKDADTKYQIILAKYMDSDLHDYHKQRVKELSLLNNVLDKRQLSYKIAANSAYGAMGVIKGYLPFMPGAMCTTYMGRTNIEKISKTIPDKHGGKLVYGDTDSNYISFPEIHTAQETWDHATNVAAEVTKMFPPPISLAFEEKIYWLFFILTKKRYMYIECDEHGQVSSKIGKKGVLLARRDNAAIIRSIYEQIIKLIFAKKTKEEFEYYLITVLNKICSNSIEYKEYIITQAVGDINGMVATEKIQSRNRTMLKMGNYKVPMLPKEKKEREKQLRLKGVDNEADYYLKCLPAVVQLAQKVRGRGSIVDPGSRMEYVIIDNYVKNDSKYNKVEEFEYFEHHADVLRIDFSYYIKLMINPLDIMINTYFKKDLHMVQKQYTIRCLYRAALLESIKQISKPKLKFSI